MNAEPFLASTFVPWTVNGPTALPHGDAGAPAIPASPSGMITIGTTTAAAASAAPEARPRQLNRHLNRQLNRRPARADSGVVTDPLHVATGKLPPVPMAAGKRAPVPMSGDGAGYGMVAPES